MQPLRVLSVGLDNYEPAFLELERLGLIKLIYQDEPIQKGDVVFYDFDARHLGTFLPSVEANRVLGVRSIAATRWWGTVLPNEVSRALSRFHSVVVPGVFSFETIGKSLVCQGEGQVRRVRYPVDELEVEPTDRPTREKFTFYTIVDRSDFETNVLGAVLSFVNEFWADDNVSLVVTTFDDDSSWLEHVVRGYMMNPSDISVVKGTPTMVERLHLEGDCYVSARCGGWDPNAIQAAWMKRLVLAPSYGDLREYLPLKMADVGFQLTPRPDDARYLWAEPDLGHLACRMRDMVELWLDRDYSSLIANREAIDDRFGAPVVAQELYRVLKGE